MIFRSLDSLGNVAFSYRSLQMRSQALPCEDRVLDDFSQFVSKMALQKCNVKFSARILG